MARLDATRVHREQALPASDCGLPMGLGAGAGIERSAVGGVCAAVSGARRRVKIPDYLHETYTWAYIHRLAPAVLDNDWIVSAILWGNYRRLVQTALAELRSGQRVLQPACVYGDLSRRIALTLGPDGHLHISDIVPLQIRNCRRKLRDLGNVSTSLRDAANPVSASYDAVCCFFLLHEMPADYRHKVVNALLRAVEPGGRVVFVDYHKPHWGNPLAGIMRLVFRYLEPFAMGLWTHEIQALAEQPAAFTWSKSTYFGGLYQKTVAVRESS